MICVLLTLEFEPINMRAFGSLLCVLLPQQWRKKMLNRLKASLFAALLVSTTACLADETPAPTPTQAYLEIHKKELAAKSYADLLPIRSKASIAHDPPMSDEEKAQIFPLFHETLPKVVTVTGESVDGNKATVKATAAPEVPLKPGQTESTTGTITMVLEDGQWKIEKESWNSTSEMK
jgi:hypothetical protein